MDEQFAEGNFLGLPDKEGAADVIIASIPYELTTSYGQGTASGAAACIEASAQVELYDDLLQEELPAGRGLFAQFNPGMEKGQHSKNNLTGLENMRLNSIKAKHSQFSSVESMAFCPVFCVDVLRRLH